MSTQPSLSTFHAFLESAFDSGPYTADDLIAFLVPLFKEVLSFHEEGKVAPFDQPDALFVNGAELDIRENQAHPPKNAGGRLQEMLQPLKAAHFQIVSNLQMDTDVSGGTVNIVDRQLHFDSAKPLTHAAYLPGIACFEHLLGHHDDQSDIFCLGLALGAMAMGLDLYEEEDLKIFVAHRSNPTAYNPRIHPAIANLLTEMTELDRERRSQDLYDIINRLEHYRDFDPEKAMDLGRLTGWKTREASTKSSFILGKLRNRLFDTSRRNRLLYYKPNMRFVNLTVSSVPMVLHYQSIRPEGLFIWNEEIASKVTGMKEMVLNKYLRFEDHAYISASLDKIRVEARHDIQEYGFSQLKLVIAFFNWHNLKEDPQERIQSPLLLLPVELKKNKKLKEDHYLVKVLSTEAEVNPVIANTLRELYGIRLPDIIDLSETTPEAFYRTLKAQIEGAKQGIQLHYLDKPRLKLIHSVARQTVSNYRRRMRRAGSATDSYKNIAYSYAPENYKPLGLELFRQRIEPKTTLLEFLVNDDIKPGTNHLNGVQERQLFELSESENNPYSWDFDVCNIVLGNFNYKKMSLVRDYNQVIENNILHPVFEKLFSEEPRALNGSSVPDKDPAEWHHVITADPTQTKAILQGRNGESYIIQGPPGTGKSQTITNLIADFVAQGKSVLFVCEKRAALDVVFHRLKQQGLGELCCYIHDSQGDKRGFIKDLKATYEDFIKNRIDLPAIAKERLALAEKMNAELELLKNYHDTNRLLSEPAGIPFRQLLERIIELKQKLPALSATEEESMPHYRDWMAYGNSIRQLSQLLEDSGAEPEFAAHPFSKLKDDLFLSETPATRLKELLTEAISLSRQIDTVLEKTGLAGTEWASFQNLKALMEDALLLQPLAESCNLALADNERPEAKAFEKEIADWQQLQKETREAEAAAANWTSPFTPADTDNALALALENESSFFSFFNGSWRNLKKQLNAAYNFSAHAVKPAYSQVLKQLQLKYKLRQELVQRTKELEEKHGLANLETASYGIARIRSKKDDRELQFLLAQPEATTMVKALYSIHQAFTSLEICLRQLLEDHETLSWSELQDELESIEANSGDLRSLLPALQAFSQLPPALRKILRKEALAPSTLEAKMALKTMNHVYRYAGTFEHCDGASIEGAVFRLRQAVTMLLKVNAAYIRARVRNHFLHHLEWSNMAASQLNAEQKEFKKNYSEGRKILENEFSKSMRYKSIRELAGKESGLVVKDLKPVWLMSPLSVSDTMPVDRVYFDVVIFDEASQITLEEGVPSLYRAPQAIIVGDDKQMPPTNFFSAKAEDPDDLEGIASEDEGELLRADADSLLVQGARKLDSVMLGWHYRSRYETLISYSNHAFYEARLLTIPDRTEHQAERELIEIDKAEDGAKNSAAIFDRSISFHFHPSSLYEKRVNADEAAYIAEMVRALLKSGTKDSIGIVAFSQEQQHTIEDALTALAATDKEMEQLLEEAYQRTEDDQYVGLIVKNLENIQGDERDIIIMSVCYGFDARKRLLMNFGPINKKGGEKRLNVIFSRARKHMAIVSSIRHQHITNEYNEGANYFKRFLNYAEQVSAGNMAAGRTILDGLVLQQGRAPASANPGIVAARLKEALEKEGYAVAEQVGQSGFRVTLAVKANADDEAYALGILVDEASHYENEDLVEQYFQRPAILREFGWKTMPVFTKDWLHHPEAVLQSIRQRLREPLPNTADHAEQEYEPPVSFTLQQATSSAEEGEGAASAGMYDHLRFERWQLKEGTSDKFWESALDGQKLVIRYGRSGTRGQTQVKRFDTVEAAEKARERAIAEKKNKGYN